MTWDAFQREVLHELGLQPWRLRVPGAEPAPVDARSLALLARAVGLLPDVLADAGVRVPAWERLREPAVKRALWPALRALRRP